ncbi:MAG: hypothetical protein M1500_02365 [Candidatus Marsarchaeota archaeon]|jgi:hypothetical protein|nr:hypothetical protein [Candidatus Marsarchaeota archaeon]MCL5112531.1 hypothetical protein [Candidatus Marsarchaeota archaeon]
MADLWSDYTDSVIDGIDNKVGSKYGLSLRDLLTDPGKFSSKQNITVTISNLQEEVNSYIDSLIASMPDQEHAFENSAAKCDSLSKQLSQAVILQARQNKVPVINPASLAKDDSRDETVYISAFDSSTSALIDRLLTHTFYVADYSYKIKSYSVASWLFSGHKNYILNAYLTPNEVLNAETARGELVDLLSTAEDYIKRFGS